MNRVLIGVIMAATMLPGSAHASSDTQAYIGGPGPYTYVNVCTQDGAPLNLGAVCFDHAPGTHLTVSIADASGLPVAARAMFVVDGEWDVEHSWPPICTSTAKISTPERWSEVQLYLAGPVEASYWCLRRGHGAGPATTGTVTATFTTD